jgi:hypothetical protein
MTTNRCTEAVSDSAAVEATVYRSFGERIFIEQDQNIGYELPGKLFDRWWLQWFWTGEELTEVDYKVAGLALHFMAAMVEAGDV